MSEASAKNYAVEIVEGLEANPPEDIYDYLEGGLDFQWVVSKHEGKPEVRRAGVMIAFGGPTAWLWTNGTAFWVDANWASESASIPGFREEFAAELFDVLVELFQS